MKSPFITMSAVTGKPTMHTIETYMKSLKENGIEQVMVYPRSGCELEYLSDEWFDTVGNFLKCAEALDMSIWLYDDYNWPSGDAGGAVSAKYPLRSIVVKGENVGEISTRSNHNSNLFGEKRFPDLLSHEATDYFISITHEQYYARFSKYFGTVIKGMFTDEPSIGYCNSDDAIPYYDGLADDYKSLCGNDFYEDIKKGDKDFCETVLSLVADRFKECFADKIHNWCKNHSIEMCGHLMSDDMPIGATHSSGNLPKLLSSFSMPGIDEIFTDFDLNYLLTLLGVAEYSKKGNLSMAELFALGPCDMTYTQKRCMIFLAACFKINRYFLAISHLDMRGNAKILDYFNDFSNSQPNFSGMRLLSEDAKIAAEYADKDFTPDVYVKYPTRICARQFFKKDCNIDNVFTELINKLSYYQIQWKFICDGEDTNGIGKIELTDNAEFAFGDTKTTDIEKICKMLAKKSFVTDSKGNLCENIFTRRLDDGGYIVVNRGDKAKDIIINGIKAEIDAFGVITDKDISYSNFTKAKADISDFNVHYNNDNIIRCMYVNNSTSALVENECGANVNVILRNDTTAKLNANEVTAENVCDSLPRGMRPLYKSTDLLTLNDGENTITSSNDYKYMPSVLLMGKFCAESTSGDICKVKLLPRKDTLSVGDYLSDYGKLEFSQTTVIPEGAKFIELCGTTLYTSLYINGTLIGEKIRSPYVYEIDDTLCGKSVDIKIVQYSSLSPIFGDVEYWDKNSNNVNWKDIKSPQPTRFGFSEVNWLK